VSAANRHGFAPKKSHPVRGDPMIYRRNQMYHRSTQQS